MPKYTINKPAPPATGWSGIKGKPGDEIEVSEELVEKYTRLGIIGEQKPAVESGVPVRTTQEVASLPTVNEQTGEVPVRRTQEPVPTQPAPARNLRGRAAREAEE